MIAALLAAEGPSIGISLAVILGVGVFAQWLAWRTQTPSIIALLIAGLILGGVFKVDPDELLGDTLFPLVSISVALILFEGGLDLPPRELRNTGTVVRRLISVGALVTFIVAAWGAYRIFELPYEPAVVLGAVLVVTGPTVVGPLLRFVRPAGRVGPILRAEGVLIDPIGATAALIAFEIVVADQADDAAIEVALIVLKTLVAGAGIGLVAALILDYGMQRFLIPDALAVPITLTFVVGAFVATNAVQEEAGLLAVTVLGIWLARRDSSTIRQVLEFNESLRTLLISTLFILLAARIETDELFDVVGPSLLFLALLIFVARPLAVIASTIRTSLPWRERAFLMAMAPRGIVAAAVSAIFALEMENREIDGAEKMVPIVFLVIIGTIVVYGFLAGPIARRLGLAEAHVDGVLIAGSNAVARGLAGSLKSHGVKSLLVDTDPYSVTRAIAAGLPARRMSVLAEEAARDLDLRGIGRLLACTSNDEVNALATARFARTFGRREVFQLAPTKLSAGGASVPEEYLGRVIGIQPITFAALDERTRSGWRVTSVSGGSSVSTATADGEFMPMVRVVDEKMAFLCRNDPIPSDGHVIGLAAPSFLERLS
jgi:NhaP-type Na+/H+ or K+/H+ antiporter